MSLHNRATSYHQSLLLRQIRFNQTVVELVIKVRSSRQTAASPRRWWDRKINACLHGRRAFHMDVLPALDTKNETGTSTTGYPILVSIAHCCHRHPLIPTLLLVSDCEWGFRKVFSFSHSSSFLQNNNNNDNEHRIPPTVHRMIPISGFLARNPPIAILSIQGIAILGGMCSAWTRNRLLEYPSSSSDATIFYRDQKVTVHGGEPVLVSKDNQKVTVHGGEPVLVSKDNPTVSTILVRFSTSSATS